MSDAAAVAGRPSAAGRPRAVIYRMVVEKHLCPFGLKALDLLQRRGYAVEDHPLRTRAETDAFKAEHDVRTTPQVFIDGQHVGGYDALRKHLGLVVRNPDAPSYRPVLAVFGVAAVMALAATWADAHTVATMRSLQWFVAFSMCLLAMLKLQDVERFSSMFLGYDLLARRVVRYAYVYPFAELLAGVLMVAGALPWLSIPLAFFIGGIGTVSVVKAVYIDKRELKCACVGGSTNVPLGVVSLIENLMMVAMAIWMWIATF